MGWGGARLAGAGQMSSGFPGTGCRFGIFLLLERVRVDPGGQRVNAAGWVRDWEWEVAARGSGGDAEWFQLMVTVHR